MVLLIDMAKAAIESLLVFISVKTFTYKCGSGIVPRLSEGTRSGPGMCEVVSL